MLQCPSAEEFQTAAQASWDCLSWGYWMLEFRDKHVIPQRREGMNINPSWAVPSHMQKVGKIMTDVENVNRKDLFIVSSDMQV